MKTYAIYTLLFLTVVGGSAGLGALSVVLYQVYFGDVSELKKSTILARINEETTIFTLDEETRVGSFFDESHRSYVPIDQIPAHMIRAMVASEDKNFYDHIGIDPIAIAKAFVDGVKNGFHFRRGGSTITQQTVKNIMDRREHTFKRKFKEMIRALQLERMYPKEQILEFYLNQFHVTANGKGVGIAAQYYFNKDIRDLDLVEAAFIAGSVKAPSKYNPFIKYTRKAREKAWLEANRRKNYVLRRMYEQGWITKDELKDAWKRKVPFNKGKFRTKEVALVSLIRSQLDKPEILEALNMESLQELNHAGLKIFTTIDAKLQKQAQLMMRRNLSRLESILQGFKIEDEEKFRPLRSLETNQFYYGKVEKVKKGKNPQIKIDFGLPKGVLTKGAIERAARILGLPTYKDYNHYVQKIIKTIKPGDILFVEVMEYDPESHQAKLELRKRPEINGGLIAIDQGEVRAVVAGFDNKGFNRAMFATRQPGSVFKAVIYYAALQLGWTVLDRLDNERRLFSFQGTYYFPRPDHKSQYKDVSLMWAGIKSENLATVYLTANLLDKLNFDEFQELLGSMGLLPEEDESPRDYHFRVAKKIGVQLENSGVREFLLDQVIEDIRPDLIFSGRLDLMRELSKLWWGRGYKAEMQNIYSLDEEEVSDRERGIRLELLKRNYKRLSMLADLVGEDWQRIADRVNAVGAEGVFSDPELRTVLTRFRVMNTVGGQPTLAYVRDLPGEEYVPEDPEKTITLAPPPGRALNPLDLRAIWGRFDALGGGAGIEQEDVLLAGFLPLRYYKNIRDRLERQFQNILAQKERYSLYQYFHHHDFRIAVGLYYLKELTKAMGVYSDIEPVLSFGLGTNDVSVAEVAKIYQTFTNGQIYRFYEEGPQNQLNLVRRIEDREGNVLYEPERQVIQLTDPCYATQMSEILKKVVTHGTGRRARGELYVDLANLAGAEKDGKVRIPAFGKTGTTNDYTTAYFAGFVPYPVRERAPLDPMNHSMVIASYVGYDLNQTMRRGNFRISGAYGALPVWTDFAKSLIKVKDYVNYMDKFDLSMISRQVWPLNRHQCTNAVRVDLPRGTVLVEGRGKNQEVFGFTNFEKEGEVFQNEFARNQSVKSVVHLATHREDGVIDARRAFQPFHRPDQDQSEVKIIKGKSAEERQSSQPAAPPDESDSEAALESSRTGETQPNNGETSDPGFAREDRRGPSNTVRPQRRGGTKPREGVRQPNSDRQQDPAEDRQPGGFEDDELW
jgi:membrane peptidoglycan carboxypeptidase